MRRRSIATPNAQPVKRNAEHAAGRM
jgi:hypothetical protein